MCISHLAVYRSQPFTQHFCLLYLHMVATVRIYRIRCNCGARAPQHRRTTPNERYLIHNNKRFIHFQCSSYAIMCLLAARRPFPIFTALWFTHRTVFADKNTQFWAKIAHTNGIVPISFNAIWIAFAAFPPEFSLKIEHFTQAVASGFRQ